MSSIPIDVKQERIAMKIEWRRQVEEYMGDPSPEAQEILNSLFVSAPENKSNLSRIPRMISDKNFADDDDSDSDNKVEIKSILRKPNESRVTLNSHFPGMKPPPWNAAISGHALPRPVATPLRGMKAPPSNADSDVSASNGRSRSPTLRRPKKIRFGAVTVAYHIAVGKQNPTPERDSIHAAVKAGMNPFATLPDEYMQRFRS